jgi:hypothetical protein
MAAFSTPLVSGQSPTPAAESLTESRLLEINEAQAQQTRWLAFIAGGILFVGVISKWRL